MPVFWAKQQVPFPINMDKNIILKFFLTKHLTNRFLYTIFLIVKGAKPDDQMRKHLRGPEVQTPSYILSPLDSGPHTSV